MHVEDVFEFDPFAHLGGVPLDGDDWTRDSEREESFFAVFRFSVFRR